MPITFACSCGKTLRAQDEYAGRRVRCPACQGAATVPAAADRPAFEVVDDPADPPPPPRARAEPVAGPESEPAAAPRPKRRDERDGGDDRPRRRRREDEGDDRGDRDDRYDDRPRRRKKPQTARADEDRDAGGRFGTRQVLAVAGGTLLILIGLVNFLLVQNQYKFGGLALAIGGGMTIYRAVNDRGGGND